MPDDEKKNSNVYRQKTDRQCVTYTGGGSPGGPDQYEHRFGPDTKAACEQWIADNCEEPMATCDPKR